MKTIGIVGGISPESTSVYYKELNNGIRIRTQQQHQAKMIIFSVDGGEIWQFRQKGDWSSQGKIIANAALALQKAGADFILLAGNTLHLVANFLESVINIPFLHIIDITAISIKKAGIKIIGLTGTSITMSERFYIERLSQHGIKAIVPNKDDQATMDRIIYKELIQGVVSTESKVAYTKIINNLVLSGAEGVILGCTELTLFKPLDCSTILFDTTLIHIEAAINYALE
ncbi:aspartate/glutamate racemase family protein [Rhizosphaericola mali]|nr:amino acid racemase [Rhizosphaericola mali]